MRTRIQAHRGISMTYAENTLPAFDAVLKTDADGVEFDVQMTKDGIVVVIHDESLQRLAGVNLFVKDLSYYELCRHNVAFYRNNGENERVPRLTDVLDMYKQSNLILNIELKNSIFPYIGLEEAVLTAVRSYHLEDQVIFSSFNHLSIRRFTEMGYGPKTGLLFSEWLYEPWQYAATVGAGALHPSYNVLQYPGLMEACNLADLSVRTWTVDDPDHMDLVLSLMPETIITNDPLTALSRRAAREVLL